MSSTAARLPLIDFGLLNIIEDNSIRISSASCLNSCKRKKNVKTVLFRVKYRDLKEEAFTLANLSSQVFEVDRVVNHVKQRCRQFFPKEIIKVRQSIWTICNYLNIENESIALVRSMQFN